jgi:hypothetical protein
VSAEEHAVIEGGDDAAILQNDSSVSGDMITV